MNKTNNKSIFLSLAILVVLTFGVITIPTKSYARTSCGEAGCNYTYSNPGGNEYTYQAPTEPIQVYYQEPQTKIVYVKSPTPKPTVVYVNSADQNPAPAAQTAPVNNTDAYDVNTKPITDLAANAVFGAPHSFMPSGIVQWILFAIFILLIVILFRKVTNADKKYHAKALKHD